MPSYPILSCYQNGIFPNPIKDIGSQRKGAFAFSVSPGYGPYKLLNECFFSPHSRFFFRFSEPFIKNIHIAHRRTGNKHQQPNTIPLLRLFYQWRPKKSPKDPGQVRAGTRRGPVGTPDNEVARAAASARRSDSMMGRRRKIPRNASFQGDWTF